MVSGHGAPVAVEHLRSLWQPDSTVADFETGLEQVYIHPVAPSARVAVGFHQSARREREAPDASGHESVSVDKS